MYAKYIEMPHGEALEKLILGSSHGAIEVEAVGLDRIRSKLARLERLREVSLDGESVAAADPPGAVADTCSGKCPGNHLVWTTQIMLSALAGRSIDDCGGNSPSVSFDCRRLSTSMEAPTIARAALPFCFVA